MKSIFDNTNHAYECHRGLFDFYPELETIFLEAFYNVDIPFTTGWYGPKHEVVYANITHNPSTLDYTIEINNPMDEGRDLLDTSIWQLAGGNEVCDCGMDYLNNALGMREDDAYEFVDMVIDGVGEETMEDYWEPVSSASTDLPASSSLNDIEEALYQLWDETEEANNEKFDYLKHYISYYIDFDNQTLRNTK